MTEAALTVDSLAAEIRRVDGNHSLGAGALAEALMPFLRAALALAADVSKTPKHDARKYGGWTCGKCSHPVAGKYSSCDACGHPDQPATRKDT